MFIMYLKTDTDKQRDRNRMESEIPARWRVGIGRRDVRNDRI